MSVRSKSPMRPPSRAGPKQGSNQKASETLTNVAARLGTPMYISDRALLPEQQTIAFVENLLRIPMLNGSTEDHLVNNYMSGADGLVTDPDFPPTAAALYPRPDAPPETATSHQLVWRRVAGALYLPTEALPQLLQGCMNNGSFLGALAAVACYPDLLLDLIVSDDQAAAGVFTLQFFKHGCWHHVAIDNYLPCLQGEDKLAFACSAHAGELWPSFIEKAYAKVHGSYFSLEGGSVADCLTDLTGGVTTKVKVQPGTSLQQKSALWQELSSWLDEGAIIACKSKADPGTVYQEAESEGYGGVQQGAVYSVLEVRAIDNGHTKLVRIHCPWPAPGGVWQGAWSSGSPEWTSSPQAEALAAEHLDPACAWLELGDFMRAFNRLYVCRRPPTSWHQLTLHCGWQGPSAGGPPYRSPALLPPEEAHKGGVPAPTSTWCCNPQFCITVRCASEVVVAVSQADPRVEARGHVRKSQRKRGLGMMVVACKSTSAGRVWSINNPRDVVVETPLTNGRELVARFPAVPGTSYILIPYAGRAGDEGAFVVRCYASSPLEVEQLPSPLSLVLNGNWSGALAGGPETCATWGSNPQYMLSAPCRTKLVLSCQRLDIKYALLKPTPVPEQAIGVSLCLPERNTQGLVTHKTAIRTPAEMAAHSGYIDCQEAVLITILEPSTPYILVPSLASPGMEAPFELRLLSSVPLELVPLPELSSCVVQGSWQDETAGGCDLSPTWRKNPRYLLHLQQTGTIKLVLSRVTSNPCSMQHTESSSIDDMIGFYILKASDANGAIKGDMRRSVVAESAFVTTTDSSGEYDLQGGTPYVIIPCKYAAAKSGKFSLAVSSTALFTMTPL